MKRVYLASPFFNEEEIAYVEQVEKILAQKTYPSFHRCVIL